MEEPLCHLLLFFPLPSFLPWYFLLQNLWTCSPFCLLHNFRHLPPLGYTYSPFPSPIFTIYFLLSLAYTVFIILLTGPAFSPSFIVLPNSTVSFLYFLIQSVVDIFLFSVCLAVCVFLSVCDCTITGGKKYSFFLCRHSIHFRELLSVCLSLPQFSPLEGATPFSSLLVQSRALAPPAPPSLVSHESFYSQESSIFLHSYILP